MTSNNKLIFALIFAMVCNYAAKAQDQWMLHMPTLHQSYINPAHQLKNKFEISLPSFAFDFNTGGINLKDGISKNNDGVNIIDLKKIVGSLQDNHPFNGNFTVNTIDIGFKLKSLSLYAGHYVQSQTSFVLDKELANLLVNGNAPYIGKTIDLDIVGASSTFQQFYLGASKQIGKLAIGAKVKYVNGWYDVRSESSKITLTTAEDYYQIKLVNDIRLQSSGALSYNGDIDSISLNTDFTNAGFFTGNSGFALDLGLSYQVTKNLSVMASATDLGSIEWFDKAKTFTNNKTTSLNGINIKSIIDGEETEDIADSLKGAFDLVQTNGSYSVPLNAQINAGVIYVNQGYTLSAIYNTQAYVDHNKYSLSFQASKQVGKALGLGLSYSIKNNDYNNIGFLAHLSLGPVNVFAVTQNIFSALDSRKISGVNGRLGLSLAFGRPKALPVVTEE
jgi:Family of unknown function (DUF5723)